MVRKGEIVGTEVRDGQTFVIRQLPDAGPRLMARSMRESVRPSGTDLTRDENWLTGSIQKVTNSSKGASPTGSHLNRS